jgi:hypothetical protein
VTDSAAPEPVQPARVPVSKPPFAMAPPVEALLTVSVSVAECEPEAAVPVTVIG